jgi:hypothetical protein
LRYNRGSKNILDKNRFYRGIFSTLLSKTMDKSDNIAPATNISQTLDNAAPDGPGPGGTSPTLDAIDIEPDADTLPVAPKKKKKRKPKKATPKASESQTATVKDKAPEPSGLNGRPPVLCISRNKHWRYISSYHVRFSLLFLTQ